MIALVMIDLNSDLIINLVMIQSYPTLSSELYVNLTDFFEYSTILDLWVRCE